MGFELQKRKKYFIDKEGYKTMVKDFWRQFD